MTTTLRRGPRHRRSEAAIVGHATAAADRLTPALCGTPQSTEKALQRLGQQIAIVARAAETDVIIRERLAALLAPATSVLQRGAPLPFSAPLLAAVAAHDAREDASLAALLAHPGDRPKVVQWVADAKKDVEALLEGIASAERWLALGTQTW